jgi:hypothetical protein
MVLPSGQGWRGHSGVGHVQWSVVWACACPLSPLHRLHRSPRRPTHPSHPPPPSSTPPIAPPYNTHTPIADPFSFPVTPSSEVPAPPDPAPLFGSWASFKSSPDRKVRPPGWRGGAPQCDVAVRNSPFPVPC